MSILKRLAAPAAWVMFLAAPGHAQSEALPAPVAHGHSFEILSNSRVSTHAGFTSQLPREILSNVLWAMNRAPRTGAFREFYVATPENVYRYDSAGHALEVHLAGDHRYQSGSSYEVGIACDHYVESGIAIQAGLLAGTAFWNASDGTVISCPMKYAADFANVNWSPAHPVLMVNVFGQAAAPGLKSIVQAVSSDASLPSPRVDGPDTFEVLLASLRQDSLFKPDPLPLDTLSQVLWAGCGVTPHIVSGGKRGLTVPSAIAAYYLTRKVYLVRDAGVHRYHNRTPPGTGLTTSDHRLEFVQGDDRRPQLRSACPRLPASAPAYIVICVNDTVRYGDQVEAGLAGFQLLAQAQCLGLAGSLLAPIRFSERSAIIPALGIPVADQPCLIFSVGAPASVAAAADLSFSGTGGAWVRAKGGQPPIRIEYALGQGHSSARIAVLDLAGRPLRMFDLAPGKGLEWDGLASGRPAPSGVYFARLQTGNAACTSRFILSR